MNVYLVPASPTRYELYCEVPAAEPDETAGGTSVWARMKNVFHRTLAEGEAARRTPGLPAADQGRVRRWIGRKLADVVAEQRLLWHLRRQDEVHLIHPDDLPPDAAIAASRACLSADRDKHLRWCVIDGALVVVSAPVALLPGPNVLAYYFIFRTVAHCLSLRGAQRGLSRIAWTPDPSAPLTALRTALPLDAAARAARVAEIASALGLDHLAPFVEGIADRAA
jgi:hypothetical protein